MGTLVNLNGAILPPDRAMVSVFDRGFLYGDSIYEVCRTYGGALFELEAHLDRLEASAERIGLTLPICAAALGRQMTYTLELAELPGEAYVRLIVTRGAGEIALDPGAAIGPQYVVIVKPLVEPTAEQQTAGVKVAFPAVRRNPREALDPAAKTGNYLNSVIAVGQAKAVDAQEAILLGMDGNVTEGASSNVFCVRAGTLVTPPLSAGILPGITRRIVIDLAKALRIPFEERALKPEELETADEAFLASSIREVLPISQVGAHRIPVGGSVTAKLRQAFRARTHAASGKRA